MASAADVVLAAVPAPVAASATPLAVNALDDDEFDVAAVQSAPVTLVDGLCPVHKKFGKRAFSCAAPDKCRMKTVIRKKKQPQGNSQAGGQ